MYVQLLNITIFKYIRIFSIILCVHFSSISFLLYDFFSKSLR